MPWKEAGQQTASKIPRKMKNSCLIELRGRHVWTKRRISETSSRIQERHPWLWFLAGKETDGVCSHRKSSSIVQYISLITSKRNKVIRTESKSEQLNRLGLISLVLEKSNGQVPVPLWYTIQCELCLDCVIFVIFFFFYIQILRGQGE